MSKNYLEGDHDVVVIAVLVIIAVLAIVGAIYLLQVSIEDIQACVKASNYTEAQCKHKLSI